MYFPDWPLLFRLPIVTFTNSLMTPAHALSPRASVSWLWNGKFHPGLATLSQGLVSERCMLRNENGDLLGANRESPFICIELELGKMLCLQIKPCLGGTEKASPCIGLMLVAVAGESRWHSHSCLTGSFFPCDKSRAWAPSISWFCPYLELVHFLCLVVQRKRRRHN